MSRTNNSILSKPFLVTLLWKQNGHHRHGVFLHTMKVIYHTLKAKDYKMVPAAFLHDFGKPVSAFQKPEDVSLKEFSFTDHEEHSFQIVKDWGFISDYTKTIVRYHYLIRDIKKHKTKDTKRYQEKKAIWDTLSNEIQDDLHRFLKYDDLGKR